jgi:ankyrin repeat protein
MMTKYFRLLFYILVITAFSHAKAGSYEDFFKAVEMNIAGTVAKLLARGFDPNSLSESGQTGLYLALREESPDVVDVLLASPQLHVDRVNAAGETPLMMAALRGNYDAAVKLIERGAKVRRVGWTPLHYAASGPDVKMVALMLDRGADVNAAAPNLNTPLMMAARYGAEESVKLLLSRGADKKRLNDKGQSAVDYARISEREFIVEMVK